MLNYWWKIRDRGRGQLRYLTLPFSDCYAPKNISFNSSFFFSITFSSVIFVFFFLPSLFYLVSELFLTTQNQPSERANISFVSFAYSANISEAALRGFGVASPPTSPPCGSWAHLTALRSSQFFHTTLFLYLNFAADRFSVTDILAWAPLPGSRSRRCFVKEG